MISRNGKSRVNFGKIPLKFLERDDSMRERQRNRNG